MKHISLFRIMTGLLSLLIYCGMALWIDFHDLMVLATDVALQVCTNMVARYMAIDDMLENVMVRFVLLVGFALGLQWLWNS